MTALWPHLTAHGSHLLDQVQVEPHALALRADDSAGTQRAMHVLEERLAGEEPVRRCRGTRPSL